MAEENSGGLSEQGIVNPIDLGVSVPIWWSSAVIHCSKGSWRRIANGLIITPRSGTAGYVAGWICVVADISVLPCCP